MKLEFSQAVLPLPRLLPLTVRHNALSLPVCVWMQEPVLLPLLQVPPSLLPLDPDVLPELPLPQLLPPQL